MAANSSFDVAARMRKVGEATQKAQKISVAKAALAAKEVHMAGLLHDAPGGRLRNVGKKGAKLSVRFKVKGEANNSSAILEATGPWQILNNPAKAHRIEGKKGKTLHFGRMFRASVHHPGHRGKSTWQKSVPEAMKAASRELNKTTVRIVQEAFKG